MYCIGDQVIYGVHGVCRIVAEDCRSVDRKQLNYLVLEPEGQTGARYLVPTHNAVVMGKLRKILTAEEMEALLCSDTVRSAEWIRDDNQRKQIYRDLVSGGDRISIMRMVHLLYTYKAEKFVAGRKFHQCDDNFLRDAEKLLTGEIAISMGMTHDEARTYLREKLK